LPKKQFTFLFIFLVVDIGEHLYWTKGSGRKHWWLLLLTAWFAPAAHPAAPALQAFADHDTGPQDVSGKPGSAGQ
jgi:hypothetical protein